MDIITGIFVVLVCLILVWLLTLWFAGLIILLVAGYLVIALVRTGYRLLGRSCIMSSTSDATG